MRVCVVGGGGREHALAAAMGRFHEVLVTPGNAGIPGSVDAAPRDLHADLYVVGPEQPLVDGLADALRAAGRLVFGPGADGARLEGSKAFMKEVLAEAGVPTAQHGTFTEEGPALAYLERQAPPYVVKTDGLAAGKGVLVTDELTEARQAVRAYLSGEAFGAAGRRLIIEEGLSGPEVSVFAVCDGRQAVLLPAARDHKRVGDGDTGPNTGGMGAFSPVPGCDQAFLDEVGERFITPTLAALAQRGIDYRGVLFAGLMLTGDGPKLLEYNVRFGDPETQVLLPRFDSDPAELLAEAAAGALAGRPRFSADAMVTVVCASEGYPVSPRVGDRIEGLDAAQSVPGASVFCAGVADDGEGNLLTAGGRVLNVCGRGRSMTEAREAAYGAVALLSWPGMVFRTDIGAAP